MMFDAVIPLKSITAQWSNVVLYIFKDGDRFGNEENKENVSNSTLFKRSGRNLKHLN
jgi:hypothetical protein